MTVSDQGGCAVSGPVARLGAELLDEYRREYGVGPKGINSGYCSSFAEDLCARLRMEKFEGAFPLDASDVATRLRHGEGEHVWTYYDGRHFDAEVLDGVLDWRDLPFFGRHYTKRRRPSRRDPVEVERARLRRSSGATAFAFKGMDAAIAAFAHQPRPSKESVARALGQSVDETIEQLAREKCTAEAAGQCFTRGDGTHCVCWWDGEEPCCACGFTTIDRERVTGRPLTEEEAQAAYEVAKPFDLPEERLSEIVEFATEPMKIVDAHFPLRGPCGFCSSDHDARHRVLDAIVDRHRAGDSVAVLAKDYDRPRIAIQAVVAAWQP